MRCYSTTRALRLSLLVLTAVLIATAPSWARNVVNDSGKFTLSIPDDWPVSNEVSGPQQSAFESKDGDLWVIASPLAENITDLSADDVPDFADDQFDDMKVTSDKRDKLENMDVRLIEGTGVDEKEAIVFTMLALKPASGRILVVLVSGPKDELAGAANQAIVARILHSLRPKP